MYCVAFLRERILEKKTGNLPDNMVLYIENFIEGGADVDLSWLQSIIYSLISGLADILPVSAEAHRTLLFKIYGLKADNTIFLDLMLHLAVFSGLYFSNISHLTRISRAKRLARVPKKRRRRPLDTRSLMDFSMLKTMAIPVILGLFFYERAAQLKDNLMALAALLVVNGIILYVPQFLPGSNRDARTLSPITGLGIGLGGAIGVLPGISSMGATTSIASICGVERSYGVDMALLMEMLIMVGYIVFDIMAIVQSGVGTLSIMVLFRYLICAAIAFGSSVLAVKFLRYMAAHHNFAAFGFYSMGLALFTFILNLMA